MEPVVVPPGEGEITADTPGRTVRIKAGHELLVVTESRYAPGQRGPELHVHRRHSDAFWVLAGELIFELGAEVQQTRRGPGTFVMAPPMVAHTFRNDGPGEARFLNFHAPGARFDDYLRAMRDSSSDEEEAAAEEWFDTWEVPADGGRPVSDAVIRGPGQGDAIPAGPSSVVFKAEVHDGDGQLSLTETTIAPGFPGPVPHHHEKTLDSFYVLDGTLSLLVDEATIEAGPGTYAVVPPRNVHTFSNPGDTPVRMLHLMAPGGFEQYLKEVAATVPPGGAPDPAVMAQIAARYDFHPAR